MGRDGKTLSMPKQRVQGFPCIRAFPVAERYGFIWIWPGEASLADPGLIAQPLWADNPAWAYGGGVYHIRCDYRLMIDNLMDLTHETYVHADSIGQKEIDEADVLTRIEGEQVVTSRIMERIAAELGSPVTRVATGGLAPTIVPHCASVDIVDPYLTLEGLRIIYALNQDHE
jgi:vanillate O-demethylase monooxygenase subunit